MPGRIQLLLVQKLVWLPHSLTPFSQIQPFVRLIAEPRLQLAHLPQLSCQFLASLEAAVVCAATLDTAMMFKVGCVA